LKKNFINKAFITLSTKLHRILFIIMKHWATKLGTKKKNLNETKKKKKSIQRNNYGKLYKHMLSIFTQIEGENKVVNEQKCKSSNFFHMKFHQIFWKVRMGIVSWFQNQEWETIINCKILVFMEQLRWGTNNFVCRFAL
jgi:hypothetical protein